MTPVRYGALAYVIDGKVVRKLGRANPRVQQQRRRNANGRTYPLRPEDLCGAPTRSGERCLLARRPGQAGCWQHPEGVRVTPEGRG